MMTPAELQRLRALEQKIKQLEQKLENMQPPIQWGKAKSMCTCSDFPYIYSHYCPIHGNG